MANTNVYRIVVCVVDTDGLGKDEVTSVIENTRYANYCIDPRVVSVDSVPVQWSDDHPLNQRHGWRDAFARMFGVHRG